MDKNRKILLWICVYSFILTQTLHTCEGLMCFTCWRFTCDEDNGSCDEMRRVPELNNKSLEISQNWRSSPRCPDEKSDLRWNRKYIKTCTGEENSCGSYYIRITAAVARNSRQKTPFAILVTPNYYYSSIVALGCVKSNKIIPVNNNDSVKINATVNNNVPAVLHPEVNYSETTVETSSTTNLNNVTLPPVTVTSEYPPIVTEHPTLLPDHFNKPNENHTNDENSNFTEIKHQNNTEHENYTVGENRNRTEDENNINGTNLHVGQNQNDLEDSGEIQTENKNNSTLILHQNPLAGQDQNNTAGHYQNSTVGHNENPTTGQNQNPALGHNQNMTMGQTHIEGPNENSTVSPLQTKVEDQHQIEVQHQNRTDQNHQGGQGQHFLQGQTTNQPGIQNQNHTGIPTSTEDSSLLTNTNQSHIPNPVGTSDLNHTQTVIANHEFANQPENISIIPGNNYKLNESHNPNQRPMENLPVPPVSENHTNPLQTFPQPSQPTHGFNPNHSVEQYPPQSFAPKDDHSNPTSTSTAPTNLPENSHPIANLNLKSTYTVTPTPSDKVNAFMQHVPSGIQVDKEHNRPSELSLPVPGQTQPPMLLGTSTVKDFAHADGTNINFTPPANRTDFYQSQHNSENRTDMQRSHDLPNEPKEADGRLPMEVHVPSSTAQVPHLVPILMQTTTSTITTLSTESPLQNDENDILMAPEIRLFGTSLNKEHNIDTDSNYTSTDTILHIIKPENQDFEEDKPTTENSDDDDSPISGATLLHPPLDTDEPLNMSKTASVLEESNGSNKSDHTLPPMGNHPISADQNQNGNQDKIQIQTQHLSWDSGVDINENSGIISDAGSSLDLIPPIQSYQKRNYQYLNPLSFLDDVENVNSDDENENSTNTESENGTLTGAEEKIINTNQGTCSETFSHAWNNTLFSSIERVNITAEFYVCDTCMENLCNFEYPLGPEIEEKISETEDQVDNGVGVNTQQNRPPPVKPKPGQDSYDTNIISASSSNFKLTTFSYSFQILMLVGYFLFCL